MRANSSFPPSRCVVLSSSWKRSDMALGTVHFDLSSSSRELQASFRWTWLKVLNATRWVGRLYMYIYCYIFVLSLSVQRFRRRASDRLNVNSISFVSQSGWSPAIENPSKVSNGTSAIDFPSETLLEIGHRISSIVPRRQCRAVDSSCLNKIIAICIAVN